MKIMSSKTMYYDQFKNVYTDERDPLAPPERYLLTVRGSDFFIEKWSLGDGMEIDIAYGKWEEGSLKRKLVAEEHGLHLRQMIKWTIPAKLFDKYYERFIGKKEDDHEHTTTNET